MTKDELQKLSEVPICGCDEANLADLCEVSVDNALPVNEKMDSFFRQIRNPYLFKVGDIVVKVEFGGKCEFSDAIERVIRNNYH